MTSLAYGQRSKWLWLICLIRAIQPSTSFCSDPGAIQIHEYICLPRNYTATNLPTEKVSVVVVFDINDFPDIDDVALTLTLNLYLSLEWWEPRLLLDEDKISEKSVDSRIIVNLDAIQKHLWKPDLFISNLMEYKEVKVS